MIKLFLWVLLLGLGLFGLSKVRKSGKDAVKAEIGEQNAEAADRISEARAESPTTLSDLRDGLRSGSRKL